MLISKYIEENKDKYLSFWIDMCKLEGNSADKESVNAVVDCIESFAVSEGFSASRYSFDKAADYIVIDANPDSEKGYLYIAHSDTVFDKGSFGENPVKISDGKLYGPGVIDCKGGIAVAMLSMKALCESGYKKHLRLIITSDEEVDNSFAGKEGVELIKAMSKGFEGAFCCEVGKEGEILTSRSGIIRITVSVRGKAAHSGIAYFDGVNAIQEAAEKIVRIQKLSEKDGITYSCNIINGGERINIVPDSCAFSADIRIKSVNDKEKVIKALDSIINTEFTAGTASSYHIDSERLPMELTDGNIALFETIKNASAKFGIEKIDSYFTSGGGSDAAYSVAVGVPTVCGIGTTGDFCHTVNEYADISSLEKRAELISRVILLKTL